MNRSQSNGPELMRRLPLLPGWRVWRDGGAAAAVTTRLGTRPQLERLQFDQSSTRVLLQIGLRYRPDRFGEDISTSCRASPGKRMVSVIRRIPGNRLSAAETLPVAA